MDDQTDPSVQNVVHDKPGQIIWPGKSCDLSPHGFGIVLSHDSRWIRDDRRKNIIEREIRSYMEGEKKRRQGLGERTQKGR
jgi:hypothetical protein